MKYYINVCVAMCLLLSSLVSIGRSNSYLLSEESKMLIEGTSNVRDWAVDVTVIEGSIEMDDVSIETVEFSVPVETMKGTVAGMARHLRKAIKQKEFPVLTFAFKNVESYQGGVAVINGDLTVAGVTQTIKVTGNVEKNGNGFVIRGEKGLKMTDFNIKPPTAMLGVVKAADNIKVKFDIFLTKVEKF